MVNWPQRVTLYSCRELAITSKVQEGCEQEVAAKLGEFDHRIPPAVLGLIVKFVLVSTTKNMGYQFLFLTWSLIQGPTSDHLLLQISIAK